MSTRLAERINFSSIKNASKYPDFLDIQIKSFKDFFQLETKSDERGEEGLYNTFQDNFPITDARNQFVLEFWITLLIHLDIQFKNVLKED